MRTTFLIINLLNFESDGSADTYFEKQGEPFPSVECGTLAQTNSKPLEPDKEGWKDLCCLLDEDIWGYSDFREYAVDF